MMNKMKTRLVIALLMASLGCAVAPKNACQLVEQMPDRQHCETSHNGSVVNCEMNDIAPESWGACLESKDGEGWTCLKDNKISHYQHGPWAVWSVPSKQCPALAEQIKKFDRGQPVIVVPNPERPAPETPRKTT